jgi:fructokinase
MQMPSDDCGIGKSRIMYHGSLALRSPVTRETILNLRQASGLPVFVDVNLRAPFWDVAQIKNLIRGANWVKLNDEELAALTQQQQLDLVSLAQRFRQDHEIGTMIVTCGDRGAFMISEDQVEGVNSVPVENMVDTVGAGDAFSSMAIAGLIQGWEFKEILEAASLFAAKICGIRGAIQKDRSFYDDFMDEIH